MTALEKQIASSEKRLAKFEKNVGMYRDRADKKLALLQKSGFMVTREDFTVFKTGRWKYDYDYTLSDNAKQILTLAQYSPVVDNLLSERENAERAENEKKELEALKEKNTEKDRAEKEVELYLKLQGIVGYGNDIIKAVSAAYGVELNL